MSTIIRLQPLAGARSDSLTCCYLLQLDDFRILLDCGWDELLSMDIVDEYKKHLRSVDAVLLSYPDLHHLGALSYLFGKCGLSCPVFATVPVHNMGLMFMYDLCQSRMAMGYMDDPFTLDDVDAAFESITQLKYCQSIRPNSRYADIVITPLPAGHMIGGTVWRIVKDAEEHIMYAVDFNHKSERHLNMCSFEGESRASAALAGASRRRPVLMITNPAKPVLSRRRARDEQLVTTIAGTMRAEKDCLICSDSGGRVLELLVMLDQLWPSIKSDNNAMCNLVFLSHVSSNVVEFARSMVEWMSDQLTRSFEHSRTNPFRLSNFTICQSREQLDRIRSPKVILTSSCDLENGFARSLFLEMCQCERALVLLTGCPSPRTLGRRLIDSMVADGNGIARCSLDKIQVDVASRVKLDGEELQQALSKLDSLHLEAVDPVDGSSTMVSPDEGMLGDCLNDVPRIATSTNNRHDIRPTRMCRSCHLDFRNTAKNPFPMFPHKEHRQKSDEYGELISSADQWMDEASNVSVVGMSNPSESRAEHCGETNVMDYEEQNLLYRQVIERNKHFDIKAEILYIDFEGRSDTDSVRRIIRDQRPRNLIVVHGTEEGTLQLAETCQDIVGKPPFCPRVGEVVDATQEKNMLQVYLDGQFAQQLKYSRTKDHDLAWVSGRVVYSDEDQGARFCEAGDEQIQRRLVVKPHPTKAEADTGPAERRAVVFINDPKLSDLKMALCDQGIRAEFLGGTLMCDNVVAVKRNEAGKIVLEGTLCDTFFKVRSILYSFYAII